MAIDPEEEPANDPEESPHDLVGVNDMIEHSDAHDHLFDESETAEGADESRLMRILGDISRMLKP